MLNKLLIICWLLSLAACVNIKPWERHLLADSMLTAEDEIEEQVFENHMHRALTQGLIGGLAAGGGCGCEQ